MIWRNLEIGLSLRPDPVPYRPVLLCYHSRTMTMTHGAPRRSGRTDKVSISLDRSELSMLRKRARRLYGGNLSAVVAEGVRLVREEEGREALVAWLGDTATTTREQRESIRDEWRGASPSRRRRRIT